MNNLRTPITILAVVIIAIGAWFYWSRQTSTPAPTVAGVVSPTSPSQPTPQAPAQAPALDPSVVAATIVGTWASTQDPNYTVVIAGSGAWTDKYKGGDSSSSVSETGTYKLFTSTDPDPDFTGTLVSGAVYVKVIEGSSTLYYSVLRASGNELQLHYLAMGNTLSFVKLQ